MIQAGQIVLFAFPRTDLQKSKMRPALVLRALPGQYSDWLICMISSNTHQCIPEFFNETGLKRESVIRTTRLAVVQESMLEGTIGKIQDDRLRAIRNNIARWIREGHDEGRANFVSVNNPSE